MPATRRIDPAKAKAELAKRNTVLSAFTAELVAGKHGPQLAYLRATKQYVIAICSRRAGKTWANCALLALTAMATRNVTCVYVGITLDQVKATAWKIFKKMVVKYKLPCKTKADLTAEFTNGSTIYFGSLDDEAHVASWLGNTLAGGIAIIDECQNASSDLLEAAERVIEPALSDTTEEHPIPGRMVWSGTFPETQAGRFWELYNSQENNDAYDKFSWNRFENPFLTNQLARLQDVLNRLQITEDEPFIQRDWFGRPIYDKAATAYGYDPLKNAYEGIQPAWLLGLDLPPGEVLAMQPPEPVDCFIVGIDPAGLRDRYAIEVWAWGSSSNKLWHCFEWITEKASNPPQSQPNAALGFINKRYTVISNGWTRDHGSAAVNDDTLMREHGIANVKPAIKAAHKARVDRFRDLLWAGRAYIMKGSKLAEDLTKARWSADAREKGQWKWHSSWHPDAADAATYPLPDYFNFFEDRPKTPKTPAMLAEEAFLNTTQPNKVVYGITEAIGLYDDPGGSYGGPMD